MLNMEITTSDKLATIEFQLDWKSAKARHCDRFTAQRVNFWRDVFPPELRDGLMNKVTGESVAVDFAPGAIVPARCARKQTTVKRRQFNERGMGDETIAPRFGRFYPKGLLKDVSGVYQANMEPFRLVGVSNGHLDADLNHPLSGFEVNVTANILDVRSKFDERGGTSNAWLEIAADGPGMQARWNDERTDFFTDNPFARADETDDSIFYEKPRFVQHLDETAIGNVTSIYGEVLKPGMKVLDLMSSWTSHLPEGMEFASVVGLGMNAEELAANPRLSDYLTLDLNMADRLPFGDGEFDAIVCTASVEYLNRPLEVFREAARVLKPGGVFAVTFSNRWFPPKAIAIWSRLHEFERVGLVAEYFLESSLFGDLSTFSTRGLPRPDNDKYAKQFAYSDPIYAVVGKRR